MYLAQLYAKQAPEQFSNLKLSNAIFQKTTC